MSYQTVAKAIRYLREHAREQPSLADVADHVGLSEFHLQRVFAAWAGISPKRFVQYLTKEQAKRALREKDVLDASLDAGLSGPSRLHDLLVACDAMTPGEVRARGAGLKITWGRGETPFGTAQVATTSRGICHLSFTKSSVRDEWPNAEIVRDDRIASRVLASVFDGKKSVPVLLRGTNFQIKVWEALVKVPPGATISYSGLAKSMGIPSSTRAVASAVARNDIAYLIPCHRVIRESGELGEYRWGAEKKEIVLAYEGLRA